MYLRQSTYTRLSNLLSLQHQHHLPHPAMPLHSRLPVELIEWILSFCTPSELYQVCLTSSYMCSIAQKALVQTVNSTPTQWPQCGQFSVQSREIWTKILVARSIYPHIEDFMCKVLRYVEIDMYPRFSFHLPVNVARSQTPYQWTLEDVNSLLSKSFISASFQHLHTLCLHVELEASFPKAMEGRGTMLPSLKKLIYTGR